MIQPSGTATSYGRVNVFLEVTANHAVPTNAGKLFRPELVDIEWSREHPEDRWVVGQWTVYTRGRSGPSLSGKGMKDAPEFMESVFVHTRPRATV